MKYLPLILLALLLNTCSRGKVSYYEQGDLRTRVFLQHQLRKNDIHGEYYVVRRNDKGQIKQARHYGPGHHLLEKSQYTYNRKGALIRLHLVEYFQEGPPRVSREWRYRQGKVISREEKWFTRGRSLEKMLTVYYDDEQKPYLEETLGLGNKIINSTEYYYDYKHRLDKSRRNFFMADGRLRDYWLTIYNNDLQITTEEHYLSNNTLVASYRYTYHPVKGYREQEEILDEDRNLFITRKFNQYGFLLEEIEQDHTLKQLKRRVYTYTEKNKPDQIRIYNAADRLVKTTKYRHLRTLESFRTPGL